MGIAAKITKAYQTEVTGDVRVVRNSKRTLTRVNTPNGAPIANFESTKRTPGTLSWHMGNGTLTNAAPKVHGGFTRKMTPSTQGRISKITGMGKSVFGMARFDKSVPAGTRPFARRALPKEQIKQVRAKAPRYGVMKSIAESCDNCGVRPVSGDMPLCVTCANPMEKARKGGKHAPFVRTTGDDRDERGEDNEDEKADQLPRSFRKKSKAVFTSFPLGPLSKTYVRVDASHAEGFIKADARGYPSSQCPTCGKHGNALEVMLHMQQSGHIDDDKGTNAHTKIGRAVPELDGHTGTGTLKSLRKGYEFEVLDESHPNYHGHTGGGAGYAGKKWVHQHGPQAAADGMAGELMPVHPKTNHRHFKMGAWTTDHSPSGYQDEILGRTNDGLDDPACALPNCRHPMSQHKPTDDGPMGCVDCNNTRPRRNVRHDFR